MSLIVTTADFTGRYELPAGPHITAKLQAVIDEEETNYLVQILGATLFVLFKTAYEASVSVTPVPMPARFQKIFDPILEDNGCEVMKNDGLKKTLVYLLYFDCARKLISYATVSGGKQNESDVAKTLNATDWDIYGKYNNGVRGVEVIQWYIENNRDDYPEYNGQLFTDAHPYY